MDVNVTPSQSVDQCPRLGQSPRRRPSGPPRSRIRLSVAADVRGPVIRLSGELDTYTVSALSRRLRLPGVARSVTVDLTGLRLIDSTGGCFLASLVTRLPAKGCEVHLVVPSHLERTLGVFGLA